MITDFNLDHIAAPARIMAPVWWYGGKGHLAKKLLPLIPQGRIYVEPYAGAASVLFHRQPAPVEVLNDLNRDLVNLFRHLQDPECFAALQHRLTWTLYSLEEFRLALEILQDSESTAADRAWAFFVTQNQGFGGLAKSEGNWGRVFVSDRNMAGTTNKWRGRLKLLPWWHERLSRVQLDCRDALEIVRYWDSPDTVFYLDPPYVHETRVLGRCNVYQHEVDDAHHRDLVGVLLAIQGQAVLSAYEHPLYEPLLSAGWRLHRIETACHAAGRTRGSGLQGKGAAKREVPRTEAVYVNSKPSRGLFGGEGAGSFDEYGL
jgi:DNA adenine methylase